MATAAIPLSNNSHLNASISNGKQFSLDCLTKFNEKGRGVPIFFVKYNHIVIGRSNTNSIWIDSENVSRNHAALLKNENQWLIKDTDSTNGVYINNNQITPKVYYKLVKGDVICLGPPNICNFKFVLNSHDALALPSVYYKVPCCISSNGCVKNVSAMGPDLPDQLDAFKAQDYDTLYWKTCEPKVPKIEDDFLTENDEESEAQLLQCNFDLAELISKNEQLLNEKEGMACSVAATNGVDKVKELLDILRATTDVAKTTQKLQEQCETLTKEKEAIEEQLVEERCKNVSLTQEIQGLEMDKGRLEQNNEEIRFTLLRKNDRLMQAKMNAEMEAKQQIADALNTQIELQKEYDYAKEKLDRERVEGEKNLLQQLEDMRTELQQKCRDVDNLRSELLAFNMSNDQHFSNAHRQITAVMDLELVCSICSEFFINTVTLGCTHSFCHQCINAWKREKRGCPICRAEIVVEVNCVIIDNVIENMVLNFPSDEKKHREKVKESRSSSR